MVEVEEGREFRFRGDLYSQESTFPLVVLAFYCNCANPACIAAVPKKLFDLISR